MKSGRGVFADPISASFRKVFQALAAILGVLLLSLPLASQGNQGTIQGTVFDQSGGAIAGATVTVVDTARGISRSLTTDSAGAYVAVNLTPGAYVVRGEAKGFQALEHSNVAVEVGQNIRKAQPVHQAEDKRDDP